jgi:phosphoglycolate phosphatase
MMNSLLGGKAPAALLFDLDGTLLHSLPDLSTAIDRMLRELNGSGATDEQVGCWIGDGARTLVQRALAHVGLVADAMAVDAAMPVYQRHYSACMTDRSHLFAGVREALQHWFARGVPMACVTNKGARFTEPLLDHFELRAYMPVAVSGDTLPQRKPDPAPLLHACTQLGIAPKDAVMIGDSRNDVLAARAADMPVVCVNYGYNHGRPVALEQPDFVIDSFLELLD